MEAVTHYTSLIKQAKEAEQRDDTRTALELYEKALKQKPVLELPYGRLMVIYRKAKDYRKEMAVIKKALDVFTALHNKKKEFSNQAKVAKLSKAILKSLGAHEDDENFYPEPIAKWLKRRTIVEKKLK